MTWLVLVLVGLFLILRALRRPTPPLPRAQTPFAAFDLAGDDDDDDEDVAPPLPRPVAFAAPAVPVAPAAATTHQRPLHPPPAPDWRAQFDRTLHGPGLCSPK